MKSTVTTKERTFRYQFDEAEAHVLYAMLNMSDDKLEEWVAKQEIYDDWCGEREAIETAKNIRDQVQDDVHIE